MKYLKIPGMQKRYAQNKTIVKIAVCEVLGAGVIDKVRELDLTFECVLDDVAECADCVEQKYLETFGEPLKINTDENMFAAFAEAQQ